MTPPSRSGNDADSLRELVDSPLLAVGSVIGGKYRVESALKQGGMGAVYAARQIDLGLDVAIKVLRWDGPEGAARFAREAQTCASLRGEHVVRVFDYGRLLDGSPYLVMEMLIGRDLSQVIADGPLPWTAAVHFILEACEGLREAHEKGVIHRDLKPGNLFLAERPQREPSIKVLDFGISKVVAGEAATSALQLTTTGVVIGSPMYMSPEQIRALSTVDARTDVWSLGVILFELVTGKTPFLAPTISSLAVAIATDPTPRAAALNSDVPAALDEVIGRCLMKGPADRYPSVVALAAALAEVQRSAAQAPESVHRLHTRTTSKSHPWVDGASVAPRLGRPTLALAGAVGVVLGLVSWDYIRRSTPAPRSSPSVPVTAAVRSTAPLSTARDAGPPASREALDHPLSPPPTMADAGQAREAPASLPPPPATKKKKVGQGAKQPAAEPALPAVEPAPPSTSPTGRSGPLDTPD